MKAINRKFMCVPADLERFKESVRSLWWKNGCDTDWKKFRYSNRMIRVYSQELKRYGLQLDDISKESIRIWVKTRDLIDYHYALHHIIFQMWWAQKNNIGNVPEWRRGFLDKVTEDCYAGEQYEQKTG
jgi:hypothetical protein